MPAASLCVHSGDEGMRASVHDEGVGQSIATPEPRPDRGGWGLMFVDQLADTWGVESDSSRVWFTVAASSAARFSRRTLVRRPLIVVRAQRGDHVVGSGLGDLDEREAVRDLDRADVAAAERRTRR